MENFDNKIRNKLLNQKESTPPTEGQVQAFFEKMDANGAVPKPKGRSISFGFIQKVAASLVVLLVALTAVYFSGNVKVNNGIASTQTIQLPDASTVELNAHSEIKYNQYTWYFNRTINLKGEAFFKVKKGSAFTVESRLGTTTVLGTSFNIFSRKNKYEVKCYTGKVKVHLLPPGKNKIIVPGQAVSFIENHKLEQTKFDVEHRNWQSGSFYFDNQPLEEVLETIERQFGVEVESFEHIKKLRYTGYFSNKDLQTALKLICDPLELSYTIERKKVLIRDRKK